MNASFKARFIRLSIWAAGIFVVMCCFRLLYGYVATAPESGSVFSDYFDGITDLRKNYASEKQQASNPSAFAATSQKYEKTASLRTQIAKFDDDSRLVKQQVTAFNAIIQYEQAMGLKGKRQLHLLIGVAPAAFDSFYLAVQQIGRLKASVITKVDKTNEYKQLNAKKVSLEKILGSLNELRSHGGDLSDLVTLHDKILEIENRMQELGVELGNFDEENEFCTVKLSLYEGAEAAPQSISFIHRLKVALQWTILWYMYLGIGVVLASLAILLILLIAGRLKKMDLFKTE
ncbi:DUF4349 domain-containing protein [Chitinophaga agrisoli]|uniref:DUF4349 domain-containing protein n=1 Tax=Chitinophaga agrisoli TaxID=2607653 RepID=A0A5B2VJZ1_9BACT|nr:DUF4349 domain-containing protein [Chitinophaga agrisoli]KAA2239164.1 DUF4349 domain-containing protein [Chitinophaga agrisoli]